MSNINGFFMEATDAAAGKRTFQSRVKDFVSEHPTATKVAVLGVSVALTILAARSRQISASDGSKDVTDLTSFVPTMVRFIDGTNAHISANHSVDSLTQDNYDLYN